MRRLALLSVLSLAACDYAPEQAAMPSAVKADRIEIVKHQGWLTAYDGDRELVTYFHVELGDGVEGNYVVERDAPDPRRPCSLHIVPSDPRGQQARSAGGFQIRATVPLPLHAHDDAGYDGGIRLGHDQMQQLCDMVPNGIPVAIRA